MEDNASSGVLDVAWRSLLFVPGYDERKIMKSTMLNADIVILDLEDSVPQGMKEKARNVISSAVVEFQWSSRLCIRINPLNTIDSLKDIMLAHRLDKVDCIVIPKAESRLDHIHESTGRSLIPMIETPLGFMRINEVLGSKGVVAASWGPADLASYIGGDPAAIGDSDFMRLYFSIASHSLGVIPVDKVYFDVRNIEGFRSDAIKSRQLGYMGKMVIHPNQVTIANEVYTPSGREVEWARRVIEAYEEAMKSGRGAITLDGNLVDAVHYRIAKRILEGFQNT